MLNEDLMVEIFLRLPTKSLLRFRSVSKSLCACIGRPSFIRLHTLRSPEIFTIIHLNHRKLVYTLHSESQLPYNSYMHVTPIEYPFDSFNTVASCNGILCVYEYAKSINLWNPSTRQKVTLPDPPYWGHTRLFEFGFGFDPIIDDYKILSMTKSSSCVYTLKTRAWREIASLAAPFDIVGPYQCHFNGALHWVVTNAYHCYYIMKFDLCSEVFSTIELPEPSQRTRVVTVIKGCLAVISTTLDDQSQIWVMREYNNPSSWFVAFKVNLVIDTHWVIRAFQLKGNDDLLLLQDLHEGIMVYNLVKPEHSRLVNLSKSSRAVSIATCIESLGLLDIYGRSCEGSISPERKRSRTSEVRI